MKPASRLLAAVRSTRYLEGGTPTGLTGLLTSHAPRPHLIWLYHNTLLKLARMPESSVYRQSTEALTKHRLKIVQSQIPEGYEAWKGRVEKIFAEQGEELKRYSASIFRLPDGNPVVLDLSKGKKEVDLRSYKVEWDKDLGLAPGTPAAEATFGIEAEPALTSDQIHDIESQIGAGLIEEVLEVAGTEFKLAHEMLEAKPWEELMEKAPEGQWVYFTEGRAAHTNTQKP